MWLNLLLSGGSLVCLWGILECSLRLVGQTWRLENFSIAANAPLRQAYRVHAANDRVGWFPSPGAAEVAGQKVTFLADGILSNENPGLELQKQPRLLAVGDSFTFGAGGSVSAQETWPAILERMSQRQVLNAGVGGYGIDQTYLRAEMLLPEYQPQIVIFGLIPDDIGRAELAVRGDTPKPYFELTGAAEVVFHPVSPSFQTQGWRIWGRKILGYSYFFHLVMTRLLPDYWYGCQRVHTQGSAVGCVLLNQLGAYAQKHQIAVIVLIQWEKYPKADSVKRVNALRACLDEHMLKVLDLRAAFNQVRQQNGPRFANFYQDAMGGHLTATGNQFVAEQLWRFMQAQQLL